MRRTLYIVMAVCLALCACVEEPEYYPIPQALKDWALYDYGSYWVYQNDSTGAVDSIYIAKITFGKDSLWSDKKLKKIREVIRIEFHSSLGELIHFADLRGEFYSDLTYYTYFANHKRLSSCILLHVDAQGVIVDSTKYYIVSSRLNTLTINSSTFNEVLQVNSTSRYYYSPNVVTQDTYWISREGWIIKKTIYPSDEPESWSLLRNHTTQ